MQMLVSHVLAQHRKPAFDDFLLTWPSLSMSLTKWCPCLKDLFNYLRKLSSTLGKWKQDTSRASWHITIILLFLKKK